MNKNSDQEVIRAIKANDYEGLLKMGLMFYREDYPFGCCPSFRSSDGGPRKVFDARRLHQGLDMLPPRGGRAPRFIFSWNGLRKYVREHWRPQAREDCIWAWENLSNPPRNKQ